MKIVSHTKGIDQETFGGYHEITIRISVDELYEIQCLLDHPGALDFESELATVCGQEVIERIVKPLIAKKELV